MIVKMKKVTLLCLSDDRQATLHALRDLGVLHLTSVKAPGGHDLDAARREVARAESVLATLRANSQPAEARGEPTPPLDDPAEIVSRVEKLLTQKQVLAERADALREEEARVLPFGNFDPASILALREEGISVKLYHTTVKQELQIPEGTTLFEIKNDASGRYVAVVGQGTFEIDAREFVLPKRALAATRSEQQDVRERLQAMEDELAGLATLTERVAEHAATLEQRRLFIEAREGMGADGSISYLQGFCPVNGIDRLRQAASDGGWGLVIGDPDSDSKTPTLVHYPAWARVMRPVFSFLGIVPGYGEAEISSAFLVFLSIFFAMIIGDAGYGLLFLILIPYFRGKKFANAPPEPFRLLYIFSISTIVWGVLTGNYFGIDYAALPSLLQGIRIGWLIEQNNSMTFSLLLGAIHLTLAHGWKAVGYGRDARAAVQAGWIGVVWGIFFVARWLLVKAPFPSLTIPLLIAGLVIILAGLILKKEWMGLGLLALDLVSCFGDLMSYLRLFALGIAGIKVAEAFNGMAGDLGALLAGAIGEGALAPLGLVFAAAAMTLVLAFGHGLNIVLCAMSVLVHGIRLNALEFSMHMGMEWSGFEYKPFACRTTAGLEPAA